MVVFILARFLFPNRYGNRFLAPSYDVAGRSSILSDRTTNFLVFFVAFVYILINLHNKDCQSNTLLVRVKLHHLSG